MPEVESRLGRTLEEDYQEYYAEIGWGLERIANMRSKRRYGASFPHKRDIQLASHESEHHVLGGRPIHVPELGV
jgi:hypothetical protein